MENGTFQPIIRYLPCLLVALLGLGSACEPLPLAQPATAPLTPRAAYWAALNEAGLANTQLAKAWEQAGEQALADSIWVMSPFREIAYFQAAAPRAFAYRLSLKRGEVLRAGWQGTPDSVRLFVELFKLMPTDSSDYYQLLLSEAGDSLSHEVTETGTYLLRLQPELLVTGHYSLDLWTQPAYGSFPVQGKTNRDIWSVFGDPREGGRRTHRGIDIFAPRGTPVLAATAGVIHRVRDEGLGGKQVWLYDTLRDQSLYYAHLDSQLVVECQQVEAGDTLGTVGNTGNAQTTRPHLHLGLYHKGRHAIDPQPYVSYQLEVPPSVHSDTSQLGKIYRVKYAQTTLRVAPHPRASRLTAMDAHLPLELVAACKLWYRVRLPNGLMGYVPAGQIESTHRRLGQLELPVAAELLASAAEHAVSIAHLSPATSVDLLAQTPAYQLVSAPRGLVGWLKRN